MSYIKARDLRDLLDLARVAHDTGMIARCPGGRPMLDGYLCCHCGRDTSHPGQTCGAPLNADGSLSKRIPREVEDQ